MSSQMTKRLIAMVAACFAATSLFADTETVGGIECTHRICGGIAEKCA